MTRKTSNAASGRTGGYRNNKRKTKKLPEADIVSDRSDRNLRNLETNVVTLLFVGIFVLMMVYLVYFSVIKAPDIIDNPYNKRVDNQDVKVVRGDILAGDETTVLATTKKDEDGKEYRYYPYGSLYSHVVGLKSEKTGIEGQANFQLLHHKSGFFEQVIKDITGQKKVGNSVVTTLDAKLQQAAYDALGDNKGAVIVMEPSTGKVMAMVSKPDFNPNDADEYYKEWLGYSSSDSVLINRATQGLYAPGSTFKIVTLLEYIMENDNYGNYSFNCEGSITVEGGTTIPCSNKTVHGEENLKKAFANSCNSAFSTIGLKLNISKLQYLCDGLMFNKDIPIGLEAVRSSFVLDAASSISDIQETAIGQGKTMISPMHNLMITACIANKGVMMKPYFIQKIKTSDGEMVEETEPEVLANAVAENYASQVAEYMRAVVTEGTATALRYASYEAAGKTGTAQYGTEGLTHSWFVGFAPYDNPKVAICVIREGSENAGRSAQYIARDVLDVYFADGERTTN